VIDSGGSYSIYYALAVASKELDSDHRFVTPLAGGNKIDTHIKSLFRPDFTNTEPTAQLGPFPQWAGRDKIVAMDPWGHLAPWIFKDLIGKDNSTVPRLHKWGCLLTILVS
jgi:hypothetical protein